MPPACPQHPGYTLPEGTPTNEDCLFVAVYVPGPAAAAAEAAAAPARPARLSGPGPKGEKTGENSAGPRRDLPILFWCACHARIMDDSADSERFGHPLHPALWLAGTYMAHRTRRIHGGSFVEGSASAPGLDGSVLAQAGDGMVVVVVQYRCVLDMTSTL